MKKTIISCFIFALCFSSCCHSNLIVTDHFRSVLSSANNRIWGELYRDKRFKGDFKNLTFDVYISHLDSTLKPSEEGVVKSIKSAEAALLKSHGQTFWVLLYYKNDKVILADDTSTDMGTPDTTIAYTKDLGFPDLEEFAKIVLVPNRR